MIIYFTFYLEFGLQAIWGSFLFIYICLNIFLSYCSYKKDWEQLSIEINEKENLNDDKLQ